MTVVVITKNDAYNGDFVLRLRRVSGSRTGKKEELIIRMKDSNGKVTYGTQVILVNGVPKDLDKPQAFKDGLLKHLEDRTSEYIPLQSSLWLGTHSQTKSDNEVKGDVVDDGIPKEVRANMWKGYSPKGNTITTLLFKDWEAIRAERAKAASSRYREWQSSYATDVAKAAEIIVQNVQPVQTVDSSSTRYAQASQLLSTPH